MEKREVISCTNEEAILQAANNQEVLDFIPTNQKYNSTMEKMLYCMYGEGFISKLKEERYENIPGYFTEEDIAICEAQQILYDESFIEAYPEAKEYVLKK